ncbi:unnamed protein product [Didymodactylos carnosus]|uniref:Ketoreductase domain-containing protein n=1 Tax=Didymodactylos carnosus TaxID=1234261 RepID=A0A816AH97_9BILA|nr:unnamed protein product [Didymodactylos carnosus]CAF1598101.1 unnamed protein product [Didymodactylos carnosus]CAF4298374.1 unnamed protein product [Didymodactylos carnosus]CAF4473890.1 unnamed protein product [Didymodactylos carnosus]
MEGKHHDIYAAIDPSSSASGLNNSAKGKTVIITGAGRGIGRSISINFAKAGAKTVVLASRTAAQLAEVGKEIKMVAPECNVIQQITDVGNVESVKKLIEKAVSVSDPATAYVLVNNAGISEPNFNIADTNPEYWWNTWETNLKGTYLLTRFLLTHLSTESPSPHYIINVSSAASYWLVPGYSAYQLSKAALNRFTEIIDMEYSKSHNLKTFAVHPGCVLTDMVKTSPSETHGLFKDTPELMGGFTVWICGGQVDFASGRYLEANWDTNDILKMEKQVQESNLWKTCVFFS